MGSVYQGEVMGNALIRILRGLIPRGHVPLPTLTADVGTTFCFAPKQFLF